MRSNPNEPLLPDKDTNMDGGGIKPRLFPLNTFNTQIIRKGWNTAESQTLMKNVPNNRVTTAKYNMWTFFPVTLWNQMSKSQNIYFMIISVMQTMRSITISGGKPVQAYPTIFFMFLSMLKDLYEDLKRHKQDDEENSQKALVLNKSTNKYEKVKWLEIKIGDIIMIEADKPMPCDVLLMGSTDPKGVCYVETKSLDGETNLKMKTVHKELQNAYLKNSNLKSATSCTINSELPNNGIYKFEGAMDIDGNKISLGPENMLLRGSMLRNTEAAFGIAIFTGHETKVMQNAAQAAPKWSNLENKTNQAIVLVLVFQFVIACIASLFGSSWTFNNSAYVDDSPICAGSGTLPEYCEIENLEVAYYLALDEGDYKELGFPFFKRLGTWILICTNLVPISMIISKEVCQLVQAEQMNCDLAMMDAEQEGGMQMRAQTSNLSEELGQVEYVFSDKTGTLTANVMSFKKFSVGLTKYGTNDPMTPVEKVKQQPNVSFIDPKLDFAIKQLREIQQKSGKKQLHAEGNELEMILIFMALCHTIIIDAKSGKFNASSPDELALVNFAKQYGYEFKDRDGDDICTVVQTLNSGKTISRFFKLLNICEFTSTRKRQSVIVQEMDERKSKQEGQIYLFTKGADAIMKDLLSEKSKYSEECTQSQIHVDKFALEGLRTLFLAYKVLNKNEYAKWDKKVTEAKLQIENREEKVAEVDGQIEQELTLLGSTAIEDKLQDEVADTIRFMKRTGIKVWVLTGDKVQTAIEIGVSAGLIDQTMDRLQIEQETSELINQKLQQLNNNRKKEDEQQRNKGKKIIKKRAVIVAGHSLTIILENNNLKQQFLEITSNSDVVLACRVSPKQKADIVLMVREQQKQQGKDKVTLSIGDGANDVSMILKAHVGVGILGKEGQQAARSADFAIGQFKFLKPLLFVHGRECCRRNSFFIIYSFYKNFLYIIAQYFFGFWSVFSGQVLYEKVIYQLFNITMTSFPIMWYAVSDFQHKRDRPEFDSLELRHDLIDDEDEKYHKCIDLKTGNERGGKYFGRENSEKEMASYEESIQGKQEKKNAKSSYKNKIKLREDHPKYRKSIIGSKEILEIEKEYQDDKYFMRNPTLYKPGMENKYFSNTLMIQWVGYSFIHAFWVYMVTYYALNNNLSLWDTYGLTNDKWNSSVQSDGQTFSLWYGGHTTYGACIFIANLIVFHRQYEHNWYGAFFFSLMILAFFFFTLVESYWPDPTKFPDIAGIAIAFLSNLYMWLTITIACLGVSAFEIYLRYEQDEQEQSERDRYDQQSLLQKKHFEQSLNESKQMEELKNKENAELNKSLRIQGKQ